MLRRALLLVALLAPAAGQGQTITTSPIGPFKLSACSSTPHPAITLNWTMATGTVVSANFSYRILANLTNTCTATTSPSNVVKDTLPASLTSLSGVYPDPNANPVQTLTLEDLRAAAQADCSANPTIYVCVQLMQADGTTKAADSGTVGLRIESGPPAVPNITSVQPGQAALIVSWADGTATKVDPATYRVTAVDASCPTTCQAHSDTTSNHSLRLDGLTIGVTYAVTVTAISASGIESAASAAVNGTPIRVTDFWDQYVKDGGTDPGGCAGGPAGLLSLLAVAGLVRAARRRS